VTRQVPSDEGCPKLQQPTAEGPVGTPKGLTTVAGVVVVAAEVDVILVKVVVLLLDVVVVVVVVVAVAVAVTQLLGVATVVAVTELLATVISTVADSAALVETQLTLLLNLILLGNGKRVATVKVTLTVVGARAVGASAAARREETDGSGIVSRTTALLLVVGRGEGDLSTNSLKVRKATDGGKVRRVNVVPQLGAVAGDLLHHDRVAKLGQETVDTLNSGIGNLTLLQRAVHVPFLANATLNEVGDELRADEVHEGVSNVEVVAEVDTEVREVVMTLGGSVEEQLQVLEVNTVRDVAQHDGGTDIDAGLDLHQVDGLGLVPSPELHVRLVDRGVSGQGPPVGLDAARRMATVTTTVATTVVTTTETAGSVVATMTRSIATSLRTGGVVVVAVIGLTGDGKVLSSVHKVNHTRSGRMNVALVTRCNILLYAHSHGVLKLLVRTQEGRGKECGGAKEEENNDLRRSKQHPCQPNQQ
jgi:hypothetical protein